MNKLVLIRLKSVMYHLKKSFSGKRKGFTAFLVPVLLLSLFGVEVMLFEAFKIMTALLNTSFPWLYFSLLGIMAFGLGIFGTVFTTQNQMYEAKDNELLLAMPIKPRAIIMSRVLVLYLITVIFTAIVVIPAGFAYFSAKGFSLSVFLILFAGMLIMSLLTQAVTCLLGWLLHFLLAGVRHKAIIATVFMTAFMVLYFVAINRLESLIYSLVENGEKIASAVQSFVWPFYAFGKACLGDLKYLLLFILLGAAVFVIIYVVLVSTFTKAMLSANKKKSAAKQKRDEKIRTAEWSIVKKETKYFFNSTTYLVNLGMGIIMVLVLAVTGVVMREKVLATTAQLGFSKELLPFLLPMTFGVLAGMTAISAPSISLEGKRIWILRSMPISGAKILKSKLLFHCVATIPTALVSALILSIAFQFSILNIILSIAIAGELYFLCGTMGIIFNCCFPRLDWPNEAAPCKQSMSLLLTMVLMFIIGSAMGGFGMLLARSFPGIELLVLFLILLVLLLLDYLTFLLMQKWGGRRFDEL